MKNFNFTISDDAHFKLEKIKKEKNIGNNADAMEFLINQVFDALFGGS